MEGSDFTLPFSNQWKSWASDQTLMCMIGKLCKDQKADWPKHLSKLVQAYNSMRLAITGYSLHYLMFECWPCLPVDFYFPVMRGLEKHQCVDCYIAKLHEWIWEVFTEAQVQYTSEAERQKWYYDRKANAISLEKVTSLWLKLIPMRGTGKWRTSGRRNHMKWNIKLL